MTLSFDVAFGLALLCFSAGVLTAGLSGLLGVWWAMVRLELDEELQMWRWMDTLLELAGVTL